MIKINSLQFVEASLRLRTLNGFYESLLICSRTTEHEVYDFESTIEDILVSKKTNWRVVTDQLTTD